MSVRYPCHRCGRRRHRGKESTKNSRKTHGHRLSCTDCLRRQRHAFSGPSYVLVAHCPTFFNNACIYSVKLTTSLAPRNNYTIYWTQFEHPTFLHSRHWPGAFCFGRHRWVIETANSVHFTRVESSVQSVAQLHSKMSRGKIFAWPLWILNYPSLKHCCKWNYGIFWKKVFRATGLLLLSYLW